MRCAPIVLLFSLGIQTMLAGPAEILVLRHAEKSDDKSDIHLTARGEERARALASLLTTNRALLGNGLPVAVFVARPVPDHSRRSYETMVPLAKRLGLKIQAPDAPDQFAALARSILSNTAYDGKTVVICWVHTYLPDLAKELGVKAKPAPWPGGVYDRVWRITYKGGKAKLADLPQHLLPGDSRR